MAPKDRAPASTMDRAGIYVDRGRVSPEQALAARIKDLGTTPEQIRAWAEREGVPTPRWGVNDDVVQEYACAVTVFVELAAAAHPTAVPTAEPATAGADLEEPPCPTPTPTPPTPAPKPRRPKATSAATGTSRTRSSAPVPPTPAASTPTDSATSGPTPTTTTTTSSPPPASTPPDAGPTAQGARRAADRHASTRPTIAVPVDGEDTVVPWPHPNRQPAVNVLPEHAPTDPEHDDASTPVVALDVDQALAAARRLGARGVPGRQLWARLVDLDEHLTARITADTWTCHVCHKPVRGEHVARTGRPIHGDPATRGGCYATTTGRKTA